MEYSKKFDNKNNYTSYIEGSDVILPNVSYIEGTDEIKYNKKREATVYVAMTSPSYQEIAPPEGSFEYSYDKLDWYPMSRFVIFGVEGKECIYIRGNNPNGINSSFSIFGDSSRVDISGNAMALLNWRNPDINMPENAFNNLFNGCEALRSVSDDFLPCKTLANGCYSGMFYMCLNLIKAPELPATSLADNCYDNMFFRCSSLITPPSILPATTLASGCYDRMFRRCLRITTAPILPAPTLIGGCYSQMFRDCSGLQEIRCYATDLGEGNISQWTYGVDGTGNFYGKTAANWSDGENGIPNGWTKHLD